jgi:integrase
MSEKSLAADLSRAARHARGKQANLTFDGREKSLARFARFLWESGFQIHTTGQIREKHITAWAADMVERGHTKRTIANNMAHIRTALEGIKRRPFADKISNASLGIGGASRAGAKVPMSAGKFAQYLPAVARIDVGVATALELEAEFGLRAKEAVRAIESLTEWERALANPQADGWVTVIYGTKGGKTRRCPPLDRERALELVRRAIALTRSQRGKLVVKPTLEQALSRYHYVVRKAGMVDEDAPHSLRYAYACEHLRRQKVAGVSRREAAAGVSTWLGHGDGRGTWVEYVYGRNELSATEVCDA